MRRIILLIFVVSGGILGAQAVQASHGPSQSRSLSATMSLLRTPSTRYIMRMQAHEQPSAEIASSTKQAAASLRLANSVFSPATVLSSFDRVEPNSQADGDYFAAFHSKTFELLNRVDGYYEKATWTPAGSTDVASFRYQGSTFPDAATAQAAYNDGVATMQSKYGASESDCSAAATITCTLAKITDSTTTTFVFVFQTHQCVAETEADATTALYNANTTQFNTIAAAVAAAAANAIISACSGTVTNPTPTATSTPTTTTTEFSVISVRIEKKGAAPDWNQVKPQVTNVKVGKTVKVAVYWQLTSAPANTKVSYTISLSRNGVSIGHNDFAGTLTYTPGTDYTNAIEYKVTQAGTYTATWRVTVNGSAKQARSSFTAVNKAPPPPPAVSFSFDKLTVLDSTGHARTSFASGQALKTVATYTVRNVSHLLSGQVSFQFQTQNGGAGAFHTRFGDTVPIVIQQSGTRSSVHSSQSGFTSAIPGQVTVVRIAVGVSIGRSFQQKHIDIQVR